VISASLLSSAGVITRLFRREDPELITNKVESKGKRSTDQGSYRRPPPFQLAHWMHIRYHRPGAAYVYERSKNGDKQELTCLNEFIFMTRPVERPISVDQIAVQYRTNECDCFVEGERGSGLPSAGENDQEIKDGEVDKGVDRPHHRKPDQLYR